MTVGEVAAGAGAGVSERSVFRLFATKEDLVLEDRPDAFAAFIATLHRAPGELSVIDAISVTNRLFAPAPGDVAADNRRVELIRATPSLHRSWIASLDRLEPQLREWLAARTGHDPDGIELRAATAALLAVHRLLVETWTGQAIDDYLDRTDRALAVLGDGFRSLQSSTR